MSSSDSPSAPDLLRTPLHALHVELGARMVPFAGYDMPVNYPAGILAEHLHTRAGAGLFDVSHMGQALIEGPDHAASAPLPQVTPAARIARHAFSLSGVVPDSARSEGG